MNLILKRTYFKASTIGHLYVDGREDPVFHTIEQPWLNNAVNKSCIPAATYQVRPYSSERHVNVWEIQDVPGRSKILLHIGNWVHDVKGCIAVGLSAGYMLLDCSNQKAVLSSRLAIGQLRAILDNQNEFTIKIK